MCSFVKTLPNSFTTLLLDVTVRPEFYEVPSSLPTLSIVRLSIIVAMKWYLIVLLNCISLMIKVLGFSCTSYIWLCEVYIQVSCPLKKVVLSFYDGYRSSLYIIDTSPLFSDICVANMFSEVLAYSFVFLIVSLYF